MRLWLWAVKWVLIISLDRFVLNQRPFLLFLSLREIPRVSSFRLFLSHPHCHSDTCSNIWYIVTWFMHSSVAGPQPRESGLSLLCCLLCYTRMVNPSSLLALKKKKNKRFAQERVKIASNYEHLCQSRGLCLQ